MPTTAEAIALLEARRTALAATYAAHIAPLQRAADVLVANYLRVNPSKTTAQAQAFLAARDPSYTKYVSRITMFEHQFNAKDQALQARIASLQHGMVGAGLDEEDQPASKHKARSVPGGIVAKRAASSKAKMEDEKRRLREANKAARAAIEFADPSSISRLEAQNENAEGTEKAEVASKAHRAVSKKKLVVSDGAPSSFATTWVGAASAGVVLAVCACVSVLAVMRRRHRQSESAEGYVTLA